MIVGILIGKVDRLVLKQIFLELRSLLFDPGEWQSNSKNGAQLKEKKAELKKLEAEQADEDKAKLIEAYQASGKTIDEVIAWLKG